MAQLERFNHGGHHDEHTLPVLMRAALADLQFERIHPFLDGNGRLGRLLIVLMLIETGVLQHPLLYVSLFFKQHGSLYFELLDRFRQQGDWEAWLAFFLEGLGRSGPSVRMGYGGALRKRPLTSTKQLMELSGFSLPTASKEIETLVDLDIAREITGGRRNRLLAYDAYLAVLSEDTESL
jgi:Fic family protein